MNWKNLLNKDATNWLLQDDNPSVKHFTLVDLLGKKENDSEAIEAKNLIMKTGVVPKILEKQKI